MHEELLCDAVVLPMENYQEADALLGDAMQALDMHDCGEALLSIAGGLAAADSGWTGDLDPLPPGAWNETLASHLLERAGFGGTPEEIDVLVALGAQAAVRRLVYFEGARAEDVSPSPKSQNHSIGSLVDVSMNWTSSWSTCSSKDATGGSLTRIVCVVLSLPPGFEAVRVTV